MAGKYKYSEEVRNKAIQMYRDGVPVKIISYEVGMSKSGVIYSALKAGVKARNYRSTKEVVNMFAGQIPCPWCNHQITKIEDTQKNRRYRRCYKCLKRFTTYEEYAIFDYRKKRKYERKSKVEVIERKFGDGNEIVQS